MPPLAAPALAASVEPRPAEPAARAGWLSIRWILAAAVGAAALIRGYLAWTNQGVIHPDEIFQALEQGHRWAFGFGMRPWEFRAGARSWLFPGTLGVLMKVGSALGARSGVAIARWAKLAMVGFSCAAVAGATLTAFELGGAESALVAAALMVSSPHLTLMGARAFSECACAPFILFGLWALVRSSTRPLLAGLLLGLAVVLRTQIAVVGATVFLALLVARRWRDALWLAVGGASMVVASGIFDWVTWGHPFHSLIQYLTFNTNMSRWASDRAHEPGHTYFLETAWTTFGPPLMALLALAAWGGVRRSRLILAAAVAFIAFHTSIPHKELRFLLPVEGLVWTLAAVGLVDALRRIPGIQVRPLALAAAALIAAWNGTRAADLTFADMGTFVGEARGQRSAWSLSDDIDRLLSAAGQRPDICGVATSDIIWFGGFTYLHREVPLLWGAGPKEQLSANYVIQPTSREAKQGYLEVERVGDYGLYRRDGDCFKIPDYSTDMPGI